MTTVYKSAYPAPVQDISTLQQLVGNLMQSFLPVASRNKNHFVNDIPDDLFIDTDQQLVASILSGMLSTIVKNAKDSCICLSAKIYGNVVLVHIKDYNNFSYSSVENNLQQLQPLAERVGGSVSVTSQRRNVATFAFSFTNLRMAA
jgi:hypothetical protein